MTGADFLDAVRELELRDPVYPRPAEIAALLIERGLLPPTASGSGIHRADIAASALALALVIRGSGDRPGYSITTKGKLALKAYKQATELKRPLVNYLTDPVLTNFLVRSCGYRRQEAEVA